MKIIAIRGNYGTTTPPEAGHLPEVAMMSDSSLLKDGKPFFVPDFAQQFHFTPTVVAHVSRLGKNVARRFASRYYDSLTVGLAVQATGLKGDFATAPGSIAHDFDGSAIVGAFVGLEQLPPIGAISYGVAIDGQPVFSGSTAMLRRSIDEIVEHISRYMTLKIGDLIFASQPQQKFAMEINSTVTAKIENNEILKMRIK